MKGAALPPGFAIHGALGESQIRQVWERDNAAYGEANIGFPELASWFEAYPAGGLYVWHHARIIAGSGLWPLTTSAYAALKAGQLAEDGIGPACFPAPGQAAPWWHLSGVFVEPEFRRTWVLPALLAETFWHWSEAAPLGDSAAVLACSITPGGVRILDALGFARIASVPGTAPRHELTLDPRRDGPTMAERIAQAYRGRLDASRAINL